MSVSSTKSKKIRAIAAGGAVLGLGAVITLAAWSDSEFAQGTFASRTFGIQAATDNTNFGDYSDTTGALQLTSTEQILSPGETAYYPYQLQMITDSADATVTYVGTTGAGEDTLAESSLIIEVLQTAATTCDADTTGTALNPSGTFDLTSTDPQQNLCINVTLAPEFDVATSQTANITWEFRADETLTP